MKNNSMSIDIASEASEQVKTKDIVKHHFVYGDFRVEDLKILKEDNAFNKPKGRYILVECPDNDYDEEEMSRVLTKELKSIVKSQKKRISRVLIVGLGNDDYAPDALGPEVVKRIQVTSHLSEHKPKTLISAFAPGVMAETGLESAQIIEAIKEKANIDMVVVIDSLATRRVSRLNRVVQITDTGLAPGSGIGNFRQKVNANNLKVPVIAIGVATIVDSLSLVIDALSDIDLDDDTKDLIIDKVSEKNDRNLYLSTKEVDIRVLAMARVIAESINDTFL